MLWMPKGNGNLDMHLRLGKKMKKLFFVLLTYKDVLLDGACDTAVSPFFQTSAHSISTKQVPPSRWVRVPATREKAKLEGGILCALQLHINRRNVAIVPLNIPLLKATPIGG